MHGQNLARTLQFTIEFIQNSVLAGIVESDGEAAVIESKQSQAKLLQKQTTLDETASQALLNQMTEAILASLDRSLTLNRSVPLNDDELDNSSSLQRWQ